jgi:hypothetical protein
MIVWALDYCPACKKNRRSYAEVAAGKSLRDAVVRCSWCEGTIPDPVDAVGIHVVT